MLDLAALYAQPLVADPFDHVVVEQFLLPEAISAIHKDFPVLAGAGNHKVEKLACGQAFEGLLAALRGPELAAAMSEKFGVELRDKASTITVRSHSQSSDGHIHTDSWTKLVTVLIYFNEDWPHEAGRLRLLRSPTDLDHSAVEVAPLAGTLVAFRRSDHSYHGHYPFEGERRMLQLSWLVPSRIPKLALRVTRFSTGLIKRLGLDRPNPSANR